MSWWRIRTMLLQSWYHTTHSMETWIDLLWFPIVSLTLFGFLSQVIGYADPNTAKMLIVGYLLWEVVRIGQYCVTISVMWEVWSRSFSTLFVSPITLRELMISYMISGTLKTISVVLLLGAVGYLLFNVSIFVLGPVFLLYMLILLFFSFATGMFITGLILRYNTDIQSLAWGLIYIFQPISAVLYPVSALPKGIQWLCYLSPITYVMESARGQFRGESVDWQGLFMSMLITTVYLMLSSLFLKKMFRWSQKTGALARLGM